MIKTRLLIRYLTLIYFICNGLLFLIIMSYNLISSRLTLVEDIIRCTLSVGEGRESLAAHHPILHLEFRSTDDGKSTAKSKARQSI